MSVCPACTPTHILHCPLTVIRYHIKYMHIEDYKKEEIEGFVLSMHAPLKMRLRFLVQTATSAGSGAALTPVMTAPSQDLIHQ